MKKILLALSLLGCGATTYAACPSAATTIFRCATTNNKVVEVCDMGQELSYSFGRPAKTPELTFKIAKSKTYKYLWSGQTTSEYNELFLPRGNTIYQPYHANHFNRGGEQYGLNVLVKGELVAEIMCRPTGAVRRFEQLNIRQISDDERL